MADDDETTTTTGQPATTGGLMAQVLATFEAELAGAGGAEERAPIGVPEGYVATQQNRVGQTADARSRTHAIPPRYREDFEFTPATMPPAQIEALQHDLVAAGLIPRGSTYLNGIWDDVSVSAFTGLLSLANRSGFTWQQQLRVLENTEVANRPQFESQPFLRPDPASTRLSIRSLMREMVGEDRDPSPEELASLTSTFESFSRQQHGAAEAAQRAAFDAQQSGEPAPSVVQAVDPSARFQEFMEAKYAPEIRSREGVLDMTQAREGLMASVFGTQQAVLS